MKTYLDEQGRKYSVWAYGDGTYKGAYCDGSDTGWRFIRSPLLFWRNTERQAEKDLEAWALARGVNFKETWSSSNRPERESARKRLLRGLSPLRTTAWGALDIEEEWEEE